MVLAAFVLASLAAVASIAWRILGRPAPPPPRSSRRAYLAAHAALLAACAPVLVAAPSLLRPSAIEPGDSVASVRVAATLIAQGLPHGWMDVYTGGFPGAMHYQPLSVAMVAVLARAGLPVVTAAHFVGIGSVLALPHALLAALRGCGLSAAASLAGALALAWVSPERPLVGGWDAYLKQGLLAQAVTMPLLVLAAGAIASGRTRWALPALGWLCAAGHPQLLVIALLPAAAGLLLAGSRRYREATIGFALFALSAALSMVALYGHGLATLRIPFGFGQIQDWRFSGFHPLRLHDFVWEGELLDQGRAPVVTAAWAASAVALLFAAPRRGGARFVLALSTLTLLIPFSGHDLPHVGVWTRLSQNFSVTRFIAFTPIACGAAVALAADRALAALPHRWRWAAAAAGIAALTAGALPERAETLAKRRALEAGPGCGGRSPEGFDPETIASWLRPLRGGRLFIDTRAFGGRCPAMRGAQLASGAPLAENSGGPGTQAGVLVTAADVLDVHVPDGAARAEALGIRWVLHTSARAPMPREAWKVVAERGAVALSERVGGGDLWGAACVAETWTGDNDSLRTALLDDLTAKNPASADPARAVALVLAGGPRNVRRSEGPCDARGARLDPVPREPGAYEADVDVPQGALAVLRATAHPSWEVRVDGGAPLALGRGLTLIAPGFMAIPVPPGRHHVEAVFRLPPTYPALALGSPVIAAAASWSLRRRRRR
jgi:hypothetical protein